MDDLYYTRYSGYASGIEDKEHVKSSGKCQTVIPQRCSDCSPALSERKRDPPLLRVEGVGVVSQFNEADRSDRIHSARAHRHRERLA